MGMFDSQGANMIQHCKAVIASLLFAAGAFAQGITPPVPTNVTAQAYMGEHPRVVVNWQIPQGPWYCIVYRSIGDSLHFTRVFDVVGERYEDHGVVGGQTYYYYVKSAVWNDSLYLSGRSNIARASLGSSTGIRGTVRGVVRDDSTNAPIRSVRIRFFRQGFNWTNVVDVTDSDGFYEVEIDTGRYFIHAEPQPENNTIQYLSEWYDNAPDPSNATTVIVGNGTTFVANFGLRRFGPPRKSYISGTVLDQESEPLVGATVVIMRSIQEMQRLAATGCSTPGLGAEARVLSGIGYTRGVLWSGTTDGEGRFRAEVPPGGSYIAAAGKNGYRIQYFNHTADPTEAVIIVAASDTAGVNFQLSRPATTSNTVQGVVRDTTAARVPSRVILFPRPPQGRPVIIVHSGADGTFQFDNVESGTYIMLAVPYSNYTLGFYKEGQYGVSQWQSADTLNVVGPNQNRNVGVLAIQSIGLTRVSGIATASGGVQLVGSRIVARNSAGDILGMGVSSVPGTFSIDALPAGTVTLSVDKEPYNPELLVLNIPPNTYTINNINLIMTRAGATDVAADANAPDQFALSQNYPNPFNPATTIRYSLAEQTHVVLMVFDMLGREVGRLVDEVQKVGTHTVYYDASNLASGVYYYRLQAGGFRDVKRMLIVR